MAGIGKKSTQVALGGLAAALCVLLMFMTGMIPFATYALPAAAGIILIVVVIENGWKTAAIVYAAVSLLSLFVVPDREAAIIFIFFFGYYPILKQPLDQIKLRILRLPIKLVLFNAAMILGYLVIIYVLGIPDILSDFGDFGKYSAWIILGMGNLVFLVYDFALTNLIIAYRTKIRSKLLRRL